MSFVSGLIWTFLREEETENIYGAKRYVSVWLDRWQQAAVFLLVRQKNAGLWLADSDQTL